MATKKTKGGKKSTGEILKRLYAMDHDLADTQLVVKTFAREWGVSERTVRRDISMFEELGQTIEIFRHGGPDDEQVYGYPRDNDYHRMLFDQEMPFHRWGKYLPRQYLRRAGRGGV